MNKTIKDKVKEALPQLKEMDYKGLKQWAFGHSMDNRAAFPRFKKALLSFGIDYNEMKVNAFKVTPATKEIVLFSDAKASCTKFAICNQHGTPVWWGKDFGEIAEQSAAEMGAAKRAVWLAKIVKEREKLESIKLNLYVDASCLVYANRVDLNKRKNKANPLGYLAQRYGVELRVRTVRGVDNPADYYTTAKCPTWGKSGDNIDKIKLYNKGDWKGTKEEQEMDMLDGEE